MTEFSRRASGRARGPKRIQRLRTKGWRMPPGASYVGRPSRRGNPWTVQHEGRFNAWTVLDPIWIPWPQRFYCSSERVALRFAVWKFRRWARSELASRRLDVEELRGRDLVCWCPLGWPCHADVLLELANAPSAAEVPD